MGKKRTYSLSAVRFWMFVTWGAIVVVHVAVFAICSLLSGFDRSECRDAIRQVLSLMIPILSAFLGFWLSGTYDEAADEKERRSGRIVFILFGATLFGHALVLMLLLIELASLNFPAESKDSFVGIVSNYFTNLAICSTILTGPVAYLLNKKIEPFGPQSQV